MAARVQVQIGPYLFKGVLEEEKAPKTCEAIKRLLPKIKSFMSAGAAKPSGYLLVRCA
jgi:hypothetical protein